MVFIFDLDDTLYEEITFTYSGFNSVALYLSKKYNINASFLFEKLKRKQEIEGRGLLFDNVLKEIGHYSKKEVYKCIQICRYHKPQIILYNDVIPFFSKFKNVPKYIVTDGNKLVQKNKIKELCLNKYMVQSYPTRQFGIKYEKPSPFVFNLIASKEKVEPSKVIYFGDNPVKDFVGIKPLGFKTIRLLRGNYANIFLDEQHEAHIAFKSFSEINENIINSLTNA